MELYHIRVNTTDTEKAWDLREAKQRAFTVSRLVKAEIKVVDCNGKVVAKFDGDSEVA